VWKHSRESRHIRFSCRCHGCGCQPTERNCNVNYSCTETEAGHYCDDQAAQCSGGGVSNRRHRTVSAKPIQTREPRKDDRGSESRISKQETEAQRQSSERL